MRPWGKRRERSVGDGGHTPREVLNVVLAFASMRVNFDLTDWASVQEDLLAAGGHPEAGPVLWGSESP